MTTSWLGESKVSEASRRLSFGTAQANITKRSLRRPANLRISTHHRATKRNGLLIDGRKRQRRPLSLRRPHETPAFTWRAYEGRGHRQRADHGRRPAIAPADNL